MNPPRGFSFSTPLLIETSDGRQVVCPGSEAVFAYDPESGEELWKVRYPGGYSVVPRPVFGNGLVYVCSGYNRPTLFAIDPTGTGDVTKTHVVWSDDQAIPHNPSPLLVDDRLYVVSDRGVASCRDARTGELNWRERLGGNFSASPVAVNGHVIFQDENGLAIVVEDADEFVEVSRNRWAPESVRTFASFAFADEAMLCGARSNSFASSDVSHGTPAKIMQQRLCNDVRGI